MPNIRKPMLVCASASRRPHHPRRFRSSRFLRVGALTATLGITSLLLNTSLRADTLNWLNTPADTLFENILNWQIGNTGVNGLPGVGSDAFNSTSNNIDYLIGAGSRTIQSFSNSGGGTFNLNLSDPAGQTFTVTGNVSNYSSYDPVTSTIVPSSINITGASEFGQPLSTVTFNSAGGYLNNTSLITVHDYGHLVSFADTISNSGTLEGNNNSFIDIRQIFGASNTLSNSGTINALSGAYVYITNTATTNELNAILNADGSGYLRINSTSFTNNGTIQTTDGGYISIANTNNLEFINNNHILADGTAASFQPSVNLVGKLLINNADGVIEARNSNGANVALDFKTINNNGLMTAGDAQSFLSINSNTSSSTINNNFAISASNSGDVNVSSRTFNNLAYLDSVTGSPNNALGLSAFRNGQVFVGYNVLSNAVFNNGDIAGSTPGWVHAYSDLNDLGTHIRIDSNINNNTGSHITSESILGGAGFQRIDLNIFSDFSNLHTNLTNSGTIEALAGGDIHSYATTLTNNSTGVITSDGVNTAALTLNNRPDSLFADPSVSPYASAVYLGDDSYKIPTVQNSGTIQATNGGFLSVSAQNLNNNTNGLLTAQGADLNSGNVSTLYLGNLTTSVNQITNAGVISAQNGGNTNIIFSQFNNSGSLLSNGAGVINTSVVPASGDIVSKYSPAIIRLFSSYDGSAVSDALINTGSIAATNGGQIWTIPWASEVPFTNKGIMSADGVGLQTLTLHSDGGTVADYAHSNIDFAQGSYVSAAQYIPGTFTNDLSGTISSTNGAYLNIRTLGGDIVNSGQIMVDGLGILHQENFSGGGSSTLSTGSWLTLTSQALENPYDTSGSPARGGAFLNTGTMTASYGTLLAARAENGLTNAGSIIVHGDSFGIRAHVQLESDVFTSSNNVVTGGNIDLISGSVLVDSWGAFTAHADANITQSAASSITARDNVTSVFLQSLGNFTNAGTIDASLQAALGLDISGNMTNSGTITASSGATLDGTVKGSFDNSGSLAFEGGTFKTNTSGGTFINTGILNANGGSFTAVAPASATNTGTMTAQNGGSVTVQNSTVLNNSGTIRVGNASAITFNGGETQVGASSRTQVDSGGTLTVGGSGLVLGTGLVALDGGTLAGYGTVVGDVTNLSGTISPGGSPGRLTINGNFTQGPNGLLLIQIEGTTPGITYDVLDVTGNVFLDGGLTVDFDSAFQPMAGETFDFLNYGGTLSGQFNPNSIRVLGLNNTMSYQFNFANGHSDLIITSAGPTAVPEPGSMALLAGMIVSGGAAFLRRRKFASKAIQAV